LRRFGYLLAAATFVVAACSSSGGGTVQKPLLGDIATPLATEAPTSATATDKPTATPTATNKPTATPKSTTKPGTTPKPTKKPATGSAFYKPPGWDGYSDVDCSDFDTFKHALSFFRGTGGSTTNDRYGLDREHDGKPCETLP